MILSFTPIAFLFFKNLLLCFIESCKRNDKEGLLLHEKESETVPTCKVYNAPRSPNYKFVYGIVRRWTLDGVKFTLEDIGSALLKNATYLLVRYLVLWSHC